MYMRVVLLAAGLASAPVAGAELSVAVSVSDLDLATKEGVKGLDGRLRRAAREICARGGSWYPPELRWRAECEAVALQAAAARKQALIAAAMRSNDLAEASGN
jgi:UrcA family protein